MESLPFTGDAFCLKCGKVLSNTDREYCRDCETKERFFDSGRGTLIHTDTVRDAVYRFKYGGQRYYSEIFAGLIYRSAWRQVLLWNPLVIVPIPLHASRRKQRGYNQCELLAKNISQLFSIPYSNNLIFRRKKTKKQKDLTVSERLDNMRNAFEVREDAREYSCVLLVDDIFTTGATINEAARCLKEAGVKRVVFLSISIGQED